MHLAEVSPPASCNHYANRTPTESNDPDLAAVRHHSHLLPPSYRWLHRDNIVVGVEDIIWVPPLLHLSEPREVGTIRFPTRSWPSSRSRSLT